MKKNFQGKIIKEGEADSVNLTNVKERKIEKPEDYEESPVYIYYDWCKRCGICVAICPTGVLGTLPDGAPYVKYPEKCIHCEKCDMLCPDYAITGAAQEERRKSVKK